MVSVQLRASQSGLAVAVTFTVPLPELAVGVTLTHEQGLVAFQLQPLVAETFTIMLPPAPGANQPVGLIEKLPDPAA